MDDKELKEWLKERDAALLTHDTTVFKNFYEKWKQKGLYQSELPTSDVVVRASMEKAILCINAAEDEKAKAKEWLITHGFTTSI